MFFLKNTKISALKFFGLVIVVALLTAACDAVITTETTIPGLETPLGTDEGIPVTGETTESVVEGTTVTTDTIEPGTEITGTEVTETGTADTGTPAADTTGTAQAGVPVLDNISGELEILGFSLGDEIASARVDEFENLYPDVDVNLAEGALDEQQLLTAVASGDPPDLVYIGRDVLSTYAARGALLPLTDCISSAGIDMSTFRQAAVNEVTVDGVVYGIPEFYNVVVVIVNNNALEEAGISIDEIDLSDWDSIRELNDSLTVVDDDDLTRIGFDPKLPEFLPLWVAANDGQLISDDGRTAMLNSPEVVEALEFAASLQETAGGNADFMAFRDTWDFFGAGNQMVENQIAIMPMEQWYLNVLVENSPDVNITVLPFKARDGSDISYATGNAWATPSGADNVEAACAFMKTMTAAETWQKAAQARADARGADGVPFTGVYTANTQADDLIFDQILQSTGDTMWDDAIQAARAAMDNAVTIPANPAGAEFKQAWMDAVTRVLSGEQTAQEALDQAQEETQAALDGAAGPGAIDTTEPGTTDTAEPDVTDTAEPATETSTEAVTNTPASGETETTTPVP